MPGQANCLAVAYFPSISGVESYLVTLYCQFRSRPRDSRPSTHPYPSSAIDLLFLSFQAESQAEESRLRNVVQELRAELREMEVVKQASPQGGRKLRALYPFSYSIFIKFFLCPKS